MPLLRSFEPGHRCTVHVYVTTLAAVTLGRARGSKLTPELPGREALVPSAEGGAGANTQRPTDHQPQAPMLPEHSAAAADAVTQNPLAELAASELARGVEAEGDEERPSTGDAQLWQVCTANSKAPTNFHQATVYYCVSSRTSTLAKKLR